MTVHVGESGTIVLAGNCSVEDAETLVRLLLADPDAAVRVLLQSGRWSLDRGDFHAEWDASTARGRIRQTANPYSIDAVLRTHPEVGEYNQTI